MTTLHVKNNTIRGIVEVSFDRGDGTKRQQSLLSFVVVERGIVASLTHRRCNTPPPPSHDNIPSCEGHDFSLEQFIFHKQCPSRKIFEKVILFFIKIVNFCPQGQFTKKYSRDFVPRTKIYDFPTKFFARGRTQKIVIVFTCVVIIL